MTLKEIETLLSANGITFKLNEFQNETAYLQHLTPFPYTKNAKPDKIIALIIKSKNGKKDIELQFDEIDGIFCFQELYFGNYCYEMFDTKEEYLANELLTNINEIKNGSCTVITANNIKRKCWLYDGSFNLNDDDDSFGKPGFEKAMRKIKKQKGFLLKLFKTKIQYEIYDWNTYECITK